MSGKGRAVGFAPGENTFYPTAPRGGRAGARPQRRPPGAVAVAARPGREWRRRLGAAMGRSECPRAPLPSPPLPCPALLSSPLPCPSPPLLSSPGRALKRLLRVRRKATELGKGLQHKCDEERRRELGVFSLRAQGNIIALTAP